MGSWFWRRIWLNGVEAKCQVSKAAMGGWMGAHKIDGVHSLASPHELSMLPIRI
jgi:hypothetical protein